jgi:phosphoribosyl-AMP cyclohydrolase
MNNLRELIEWSKCMEDRVPIVIQKMGNTVWGVAFLDAAELEMMIQLDHAITRCQKKDVRFWIDCDRDAMVHRCITSKDCDDLWREIPSVPSSLQIQTPHDVSHILQPRVFWKQTYDGLLPAVIQDATDGTILMLAWMNREAWADCQLSGSTCFFSRSKNRLWRKGEESGNRQIIQNVKMFANNDLPPTLLFHVEQQGGAACHEGCRSCFYRRIERDGSLAITEERVFDPNDVYQ